MTSLFYAASKHIAKTVGSMSLHPVPDLNSAENFKTLCVVKRQTSFWFWKKPKMIATEVTLEDILLQKHQVPAEAKSFTIMEKFIEKPTFKLDGKLGAKIASEFDLSLSGDDSIDVSLSLGDIVKTEISWQLLNTFLEQHPVNVIHELLEEVRNSKRTTLCIVLASLSTKSDGDLTETRDLKVQSDVTLPSSASIVKVDISAHGSVEKETAQSFRIPQGTVLAYSCNKLSINKDGIVKLHSTVDRLDQSDGQLFLEKPSMNDQVLIIKSELAPLLESENFERFRNELKLLLEDMTQESLQAMHLLLSTAKMNVEGNSEDKSMPVSMLQHLFGLENTKPWIDFLLLLGFMIPVDTANKDAQIEFPSSKHHPLLKPCLGVIDALLDVSSSARQLLSNISTEDVKILYQIVEKQFHGKDVSKREPSIASMFMKDPSTELFLKEVGFVEMQADEDELICDTGLNRSTLDLLVVLYIIAAA